MKNLAPTTGLQSQNRSSFAADLWRHRELLWQFTVRNIEMRHRGSHLGLIWSILNPLLMLGLYVFVFGYVFRGRFNPVHPETRVDYALGIFLGLTIFHLFAEVLTSAPLIIVSNPNFVKKVVFPLGILPAASVSSSLFHGFISLCLLLMGVAFFGPGLTFYTFWIVPIIIPMVFHLLGLAWFVAAVGVFFRDITQVTGFIAMALLYASCVFFPSSSLPSYAWAILRFNPILLSVELARDAVMWHTPLDFSYMIYLYISGIAACAGGYWVFRKTSPAFADII